MNQKAPFFSPEDYHSVDEVLLVNEELKLENKRLKDRFCGCGNCLKTKECTKKIEENYCEEYVLDNEE